MSECVAQHDVQHRSLLEKYYRNANQNHSEVLSHIRQNGHHYKAYNYGGEGVEKQEPSYAVNGNANQFNSCGEQYGDSSKKLEIKLPYNQVTINTSIVM